MNKIEQYTIQIVWISEDVPNWNCVKRNKEFQLDTDEIYALERREHFTQNIKVSENTDGQNERETNNTK